MQHITMTTMAHPPSKVGPSTHHHHKHHHHTPSPLPPPPTRILRCDICMDDFEWFSLKDLNGYQEDPKDNSAAAAAASPLSRPPQICQRPFHIFCSHSRNQGTSTRARQGRGIRALFGGESRRQRRDQKLKQDSAMGPSVEALKLGCSLHMGKDHAFCLECLARYIDTQVKAQTWPIVCPHENCREVVSSFAVETLLGSEALQWHQLAVEHAIQKKIYCPSNACGRLFDGDRNDEEEAVNRNCPYCNKPFCAMCHGEAHTGMDCQQRLDKIFLTMAADSKWKSCPSCKHMIEKESGCDHMTCRCGNQFCYVCGGNGWPCRNRH